MVALRHWGAVLTCLLLAACAGTDGGVDGGPATSAGTTTAPPTIAPTTSATDSTISQGPAADTVGALIVIVSLDRSREVTVTLSVDGDWRIDDAGALLAFDAEARELHIDGPDGREAHIGLASSGPDAPSALLDAYLPLAVIPGALEAAAAGRARPGWWSGGTTIDVSEHFRRPTLAPGALGDGPTDHVWVSIDEATRLPVSVTHVSDQRPVEVSVRHWEVVSAETTRVERAAFSLWPEPPVAVTDHGFTPVDPGAIGDAIGHDSPLPAWVPDGYALAAVDWASAPLLWWSYPSLPPSQQVAVITFRRGMLDTLTVTARSDATGDWQNPYHRGDMDLTGTTYTTPDGARFSVVTGPWPFWPVTHAWTINDDLVVTVGGDVTVTELRAILDHLAWPHRR